MNRPPDMIRFLGGPVGRHEVGWTGPWPPPDYLTLAHGTESGITKVVPDGFDLTALQQAPSIEVTVYRLRNASALPDDLDSPYVFRGAEYVPDEAVIQ